MVKNYNLIVGKNEAGLSFLFEKNEVYLDVGDYVIVDGTCGVMLVRVTAVMTIYAEEDSCYEEEIAGKVIMEVYGLSEKLQKGAENE